MATKKRVFAPNIKNSINPKTGMSGDVSDLLNDDLNQDIHENVKQRIYAPEGYSAPSKGLTTDLINENPAFSGDKSLESIGLNRDKVQDYQEITGNTALNLSDPTLSENVARSQTNWRLAGNALMMAATEVTLGTAEGISYLFDLPQLGNILTGSGESEEFGNWLSELTGEAKDYMNEEAFNVYKTEAAEGFAPGDATWWASNAPSIASALSLMIPSYAAVKVAGKVGAWGARLTTGWAKAAKASKNIGDLNQFMNNPAVGKLANAAVGAMTSRYMESTMEAAGTVEEYKNEYRRNFENANPGIAMANEDIARMNKEAGEAGLQNWYSQLPMLAVDFAQYGTMFRSFDTTRKLGKLSNKQNYIDELADLAKTPGAKAAAQVSAKEAAKTAAKETAKKSIKETTENVAGVAKDVAKSTFAGTREFAGQVASEAAEETYQFLANKAAIANVESKKGFLNEMLGASMKYYNDPELHTSMFLGGFGGGMFHVFGPGMQKAMKVGKAGLATGGMTAEELMRAQVVSSRAAAMGDKTGFHEITKQGMVFTAIQHSQAGAIDDLIGLMKTQIEVGKENKSLTDSDIKHIESNIALVERVAEVTEQVEMRGDLNKSTKTSMKQVAAQMAYSEAMAPIIEEELGKSEAETPQGLGRLKSLTFQLEHLDKIDKDGNAVAQDETTQEIIDKKRKEINDELNPLKEEYKNRTGADYIPSTRLDDVQFKKNTKSKIEHDLGGTMFSELYKKLSEDSVFRDKYMDKKKKNIIDQVKSNINTAIVRNIGDTTKDGLITNHIKSNAELMLSEITEKELSDLEGYVDIAKADKAKYINDNVFKNSSEKNQFIYDSVLNAETASEAAEALKSKLGPDEDIHKAFLNGHSSSEDIESFVKTIRNPESVDGRNFRNAFLKSQIQKAFIEGQGIPYTPEMNQASNSSVTTFESPQELQRFLDKFNSNTMGIKRVEEHPAQDGTTILNGVFLDSKKKPIENGDRYYELKNDENGNAIIYVKRHYTAIVKNEDGSDKVMWLDGLTSTVNPSDFSDADKANWPIAALVGTESDEIARDFFKFKNENPDKEFTRKRSENSYLTEGAHTELITSLEHFHNELQKLGDFGYVTENLFLGNIELGVATEMDLMIVNRVDNSIHISDFKTIREKNKLKFAFGDKIKGYQKQLSAEYIMMEEMFGVKATSISLLGISTKYDEGAHVTHSESAKANDVLIHMDTLKRADQVFTGKESHRAEAFDAKKASDQKAIVEGLETAFSKQKEKFDEANKKNEPETTETETTKEVTSADNLLKDETGKAEKTENEKIEGEDAYIKELSESTTSGNNPVLSSDEYTGDEPLISDVTVMDDGSVYVNRPELLKKFKAKAWTNMAGLVRALTGVKSRPKNLEVDRFETYEEFEAFVVERTIQRKFYPVEEYNADMKSEGARGSKGGYEGRLNDRALNKIRNTRGALFALQGFKTDKDGHIINGKRISDDGNSYNFNTNRNKTNEFGRLPQEYSQSPLLNLDPEYVLDGNLAIGDVLTFHVDTSALRNRSSDKDPGINYNISVVKTDPKTGEKHAVAMLPFYTESGKHDNLSTSNEAWMKNFRETVAKIVKAKNDNSNNQIIEIEGYQTEIEEMGTGLMVNTQNLINPVDAFANEDFPLVFAHAVKDGNQIYIHVPNIDSIPKSAAFRARYGDNFDFSGSNIVVQDDYLQKQFPNGKDRSGQLFVLVPGLNGQMQIRSLNKTDISSDPKKQEALQSAVNAILQIPDSDIELKKDLLKGITDIASIAEGSLDYKDGQFILLKGSQIYTEAGTRETALKDVSYDPQEFIHYAESMFANIDTTELNLKGYNEKISNDGTVSVDLPTGHKFINPQVVTSNIHSTSSEKSGSSYEMGKKQPGSSVPDNSETPNNSTPIVSEKEEEDIKAKIAEKKAKRAAQRAKQSGSDPKHNPSIFGEPTESKTIGQAKRVLDIVLPNVPLNVVESLLEISKNGGVAADGVFRDSMMTIFNKANGGVAYHEAGHAIFRMFNTPAQQAALLKQVRKEHGKADQYKIDQLNKVFPGKSKKWISDMYYEEVLAEDFRKFLSDNENNIENKSFIGEILDFFKRLYYYVKNIMTDNISIDEMYNRALVGYYAKSKATESYQKTIQEDPAYNHQFSQQQQKEIIKYVASELTVDLIGAQHKIDDPRAPIYEPMTGKKSWGSLLSKVYDKIDKQADLEYEMNGASARFDMLDNILDLILNDSDVEGGFNLGEISAKAINSLPGYSYDQDSLGDGKVVLYNEIQPDDSAEVTDSDSGSVEDVDLLESWMFDKRHIDSWETLSTEVKMYLNTFPVFENGKIKTSSIGLPEYHDAQVVFKKLQEKTINSTSPEMAKAKLKEAALYSDDKIMSIIYDDLYSLPGEKSMRASLGLPQISNLDKIRDDYVGQIAGLTRYNILSINVNYSEKNGTSYVVFKPTLENTVAKLFKTWNDSVSGAHNPNPENIDTSGIPTEKGAALAAQAIIDLTAQIDHIRKGVIQADNQAKAGGYDPEPINLSQEEIEALSTKVVNLLFDFGLLVNEDKIKKLFKTDRSTMQFLGNPNTYSKGRSNFKSVLSQIASSGGQSIFRRSKPVLQGMLSHVADKMDSRTNPGYRTSDGRYKHANSQGGYAQRFINDITSNIKDASGTAIHVNKLNDAIDPNQGPFQSLAPIYKMLRKDDFRNNFEHFVFGAMIDQKGDSEYSSWAGTRKYFESSVGLFWNSGADNGKKSHYFNAVLGDSSTATGVTSSKLSNSDAVEALYESVYQETQRIRGNYKSKNSHGVKNYEENASEYILMDFMKGYVTEFEKNFREEFPGQDAKLASIDSITKNKSEVKAYIREHFKNLSNKYYEQTVSYGMKIGDGIPSGIKLDSRYNKEGKSSDEDAIKNFFYHFALNDTFINSQLITMIQGDPAFYGAENGQGNVSTDFFKRAKEAHSPIAFNNMGVNGGNNREFYDVLILQEDEAPTKHGQALLNILNNSDSRLTSDQSLKALAKFGRGTHKFVNGKLERTDINPTRYNKEDDIMNEIEFPTPKKEDVSKLNEGQEYVLLSDGSFQEIKLNSTTDGASYISIDRWKEVLDLQGIWSKRHQRLFNAVKNEESIPTDLTDIAFAPLKMFYFDHINENGLSRPFQQKDAKFLMTKEMAKGDKKLERINNVLERGVSEVSFDSTVKVGKPKTLSTFRDLSDGNIDSTIGGRTIKLKNRMAGIQQQTLGNHKDSMALGSQAEKIAMEDVDPEGTYTLPNGAEVNGETILRNYNDSIIHDVRSAYNKLLAPFTVNGVTLGNIDSSDRVSLDLARKAGASALSEKLIRLAKKLDYGQNFIDAVSLNENGEFNTPLYDGSIIERVENLLFSEFRKKLLKTKSAGGGFVNAPSVGYSDNLNIVFNDNGDIEHVEVYMSAHSQNHIALFSDEKGVIDLSKIPSEAFPDELKNALGYRIPTENRYSMFKIKVKGFLPNYAGSEIIMPREATTISGFDFDIDKLYTAFYEYDSSVTQKGFGLIYNKVNSIVKNTDGDVYFSANTMSQIKIERLISSSEEEINEGIIDGTFDQTDVKLKSLIHQAVKELNTVDNIPPYDIISIRKTPSNLGTKKGRANMRLDAILASVANKKHAAQALNPASFDTLVELKKEYSSPENLSITSMLTRDLVVNRATSGNALKGIASLARTGHAVFRNSGVSVHGFAIDQDIYTHEDGTKISVADNLSEFLAAILDNQKFPISDALNINTLTADIFTGLLRIGMSLENAVKIMKSPNMEKATKDALLSKRNNPTVLGFLKEKGQASPGAASANKLKDFINGKEVPASLDLATLILVAEIGETIKSITSATQADTKGSKSFAESENKAVLYNNLFSNENIMGFAEFASDIDAETGKKRNNPNYWFIVKNEYGAERTHDAISKMTDSPFGSPAFMSVKENIRESRGFPLSAKNIKHINMALLTSIATSSELFPDSVDRYNLMRDFPQDFQDFLDIYPESNLAKLSDHLFVMSANDSFKLDHIKQDTSNLSKEAQNDLKTIWDASLRESDVISNEEARMAVKLAKYALSINGYMFNPQSFAHLIPTDFHNSYGMFDNDGSTISLRDSVTDSLDEIRFSDVDGNSRLKSFVGEYLRHTIGTANSPIFSLNKDPRVKVAVGGKTIKYDQIASKTTSGDEIYLPNMVAYEISISDVKGYDSIKENEYIVYKDYLYKKTDMSNPSSNYRVQSRLGVPNYAIEYDLNAEPGSMSLYNNEVVPDSSDLNESLNERNATSRTAKQAVSAAESAQTIEINKLKAFSTISNQGITREFLENDINKRMLEAGTDLDLIESLGEFDAWDASQDPNDMYAKICKM